MTGQHGVIWDFDATLAERPGLWSGCMIEVLDAAEPVCRHALSLASAAEHVLAGA